MTLTTSYNLLSSEKNKDKAFEIISINPDVSNAFMLNTVSTSLTNYIDYIQLLLDGEASRYTFILTDYISFECMSADETAKVNMLIAGGKQFLVQTINNFWSYFLTLSVGLNNINNINNILASMHSILNRIYEIQEMFALIYKAILCAVKAKLYSCNPPSIAKVSDIKQFYLANKSKLEMFVYEYMVSVFVIIFGETRFNQLKNICNVLIKHINETINKRLNTIVEGIISNPQTYNFYNFMNYINVRLHGLSIEYDLKFEAAPVIRDVPSLELFLKQYPVTYFVNIEKQTEITSAIYYTTFVNFLQIVSNTLIDKETDKEEIQEQKENKVEYFDNIKYYDKEEYIWEITNLPIIKDNPSEFTPATQYQYLTVLIKLVNEILIKLFDGKMPEDPEDPDYAIILTDAVGRNNVENIKKLLGQQSVDQYSAELLQTLFLDLINRLDTDQLKKLNKINILF